MRKVTWMLAIVICISVIAAGCGKKDSGDVVQDLEGVLDKLESYEASGTMTLRAGEEAQVYQVDVWYQNPEYYRVSLSNKENDITQIVLKNDEGVFVLTPHLKKSFRFQSDWPDKRSQIYLYQSLVNNIFADGNRQFVIDDENKAYVFDVEADYQNKLLARQRIWLDQKDYAPKLVEIADDSANVLVIMEFNHFTFDKSFETKDFEMNRNLTSMDLMQILPTMNSDTEEMQGQEAEQVAASNVQTFGVIEPSYTPEGVHKHDFQDVMIGEEEGVLIRYSGDYTYSIIETRPEEHTVLGSKAELVDLGLEIGYYGVLSGEAMRTLRWTHDGVEFRLTSDNLPEEEMIKIAQSVQGMSGK